MEFDAIQKRELSVDITVDYGILRGNTSVIFIKAGAGGSCLGYDNKYLKMAHMLRSLYGCTVICASNPSVESFALSDRMLLSEYANGCSSLYYIGSSNGATLGLTVAAKHFDFQRMLLINMPLMINFHKTKEALQVIPSDILFVFGEKDPSYPYVPMLQHACKQRQYRTDFITVPHADHNFAYMQEEFVALGKAIMEQI